MAAKGNTKSPQPHLNDLIDLIYAYKTSTTRINLILETWNGESARFYMDLPDDIKIITTCYGSWQPSRNSTDNKNQVKSKSQTIKKADILLALRKALSGKLLKIPKNDGNKPFKGSDLSQQLAIYREDDARIPTDRVISLALAVYLATEGNTSKETVNFVDW